MRVKEELAALRPAAPAERRALLASLLRFAATLHIGSAAEGSGEPQGPGGFGGPQGGPPMGQAPDSKGPGPDRSRFTLVLTGGSGGVARLAFWLLHAGYGVRADFRVREAGALAFWSRYEVVLAERVE